MALTVAQLVARVTADTSGFYKSMAVMNASMIRTGGIVGRVAAGAGLAVVAMGVLSLKAAGDFQQSMNLIKAVAEPTTGQFKKMRTEAINLGNDLKLPSVSAKDAADVMYDLSRSGLTVNQTMGATRGVLLAATAAHISFGDAALITARALKAFNLPGTEANRIADLLAATANRTTASVTDLADGFQNASGQFVAAGYNIQTLTTALAIMIDRGISGAQAGTALKVMLQRLESPTTKAAAVMKDLGIHIYDAHHNMIPFPAIVSQFAEKLKGASDETRNQALNTIFGQRANQAMIKLMAGGAKTWGEYNKKVNESGVAQKIADARMQGFNGSMEKFKNAISTLAIELGTSLLPVATDLVNWGAKFVQGLDVSKIQSFFGTLKNVAVQAFNVLKPMVAFLATNPIGNSFILMGGSIYIAIKALGALRGAFLAVQAAMAVFGGASAILSGLLTGGLALAIGASVGAFLLLTGALGSLSNQVVEMYSLEGAVKRVTTSVNGLKTAMDSLTNAHLSVKEAQVGVQQSLLTLHDAAARWHADLDAGTQKTRQGVADYTAYRGAVVAHERAVDTLKNSQTALNGVMDKSQVTLTSGKKIMDELGGRAQQYIQTLGTESGKQQELDGKLANVNDKLTKSITAHVKLAQQLRVTNPVVSDTQLRIARYGTAVQEVIRKHEGFTTANIQKELKKVPWDEFKNKMLKIPPAAKKAGDDTKTGFLAGAGKMVSEATAKAALTVSGVGNKLRSGIGQARTAGSATGAGFVNGLAAWIGPAATAAASIANAAVSALNNAVQTGSDSKVTTKIGEYTASGFINGFTRYFKENEPKLKYPMLKAMLMIRSLQPEFDKASQVLGKAQVDGIIKGFIQKEPDLRQKIITALREATKAALDAAKQAVTDARSAFASAFDSLASAALSAFDAKVAGWVSPAQKMLDALDLQTTMDEIKGALGQGFVDLYDMIIANLQAGDTKAADEMTRNLLTQVNAAIAAAQGAVDAAQVNLAAVLADPNATDEQKKAAQDALDAAQQKLKDMLDARQKILTLIATAEQTAHEKLITQQRNNLQAQLDQLKIELAKHPGEWKKIQAKIIALLKKYGVDYRTIGKDLGYALAKGLRDAIPETVAAAKELAAAIAKYLKLASPAEQGPLSDLDKWWKNFGSTLISGMDTKDITATIDAMVAPPRISTATGGSRTEITYYLNATVTTPSIIGTGLDRAADELTPHIRKVLIDVARSNGLR